MHIAFLSVLAIVCITITNIVSLFSMINYFKGGKTDVYC